MAPSEIRYSRSRFSTRLIEDRLYTRGHYWLEKTEGDRWRIGFTRFAIRMLGEAVEVDFEVEPEAEVKIGDVIGWMEGFKAVTDLFAPMTGRFCGRNPIIDEDITVLVTDPYIKGWLFEMAGDPGEECIDVHAYCAVLDTTIDGMLGKRDESAEASPEGSEPDADGRQG